MNYHDLADDDFLFGRPNPSRTRRVGSRPLDVHNEARLAAVAKPDHRRPEKRQKSSKNQKNRLSSLFARMITEALMRQISAASRETRRIRILAAMLNGANYDEIAAIEKLSRERVRQIVVESLRNNDREKEDHRRIQAARLEPALKLALDAIDEGRVEAIDRLLRVLHAQDSYLDQVPSSQSREDLRQRLIAKLEAASRAPDPRAQNKPANPAPEVVRGGAPAAADIIALLEAEEARAEKVDEARAPDPDAEPL
jgi:hypothetical protein